MKNEKVYEVNVYPSWSFDCFFNPINSGSNEVMAVTDDYVHSKILMADVYHDPINHLFRVTFEYDPSMAEELEEFYDIQKSFLVKFYYGDYLDKVAEIKMVVEWYDTPDEDINNPFGIALKVSEDDYDIHTIDISEVVFKLFSKVIHTAFEDGSKDYNYVKITVQRNE